MNNKPVDPSLELHDNRNLEASETKPLHTLKLVRTEGNANRS